MAARSRDKTLYLGLPITDMSGRDQKKRVFVRRCKMCHNLSDDYDVPKYLPAGLSEHVLHPFMDRSPPFREHKKYHWASISSFGGVAVIY